ncbi:MAG: hypothetical protein OXU69_00765 [Gemmatimonadota bacterium]|nr:hypothetical protein [Gemmatimonadota bacterium]MDE2983208.1 hypothetical protein [Gemmatimonadota bacterium]
MSAAIEEARRSPFHAGARTGEPEEAHRAGPDSDSDIASARTVLQLAPSEEDPPSRWSHVPATLIVAGLSHLTATYVLWGCGGNVARCILAPIVPLVATPIPALLAGADSGRAFGASVVGLLLGGAAYIGVLKVTENFYVATAASSLVHAGMMTAALGEG